MKRNVMVALVALAFIIPAARAQESILIRSNNVKWTLLFSWLAGWRAPLIGKLQKVQACLKNHGRNLSTFSTIVVAILGSGVIYRMYKKQPRREEPPADTYSTQDREFLSAIESRNAARVQELLRAGVNPNKVVMACPHARAP